jgi:hypothetical protein
MPRSEPDHLVDAAAAARLVASIRHQPCAPGTIWSWASRGHIRRYGRGRYDVREIEAWTRRLIMDELLAFVRAQLDAHERQLDEDERVALEAVGRGRPDWTLSTIGPDGAVSVMDDEVAILARADLLDAQHIVRWNPARVLELVADQRADIEAKRRILDWAARAIQVTESDSYQLGVEDVVGLAAQPYAGRPGWREEWAA